MNTETVFIIVDEQNNVYGVEDSETKAKMQTNWFLSKEHKYKIIKRVFISEV